MLVYASNNAKKLKEARYILAKHNIEIKPLKELGLDIDPLEDGSTFKENALIKARTVFKETGLPTIADDSGLKINALNGFPGIYSARFLKGHDYAFKNNEILTMLEDVTDRRASFVCAIAYVDADKEVVFEGKVMGQIAYSASKNEGFGYDPLFYVNSAKKIMADMSSEEKNKISHRYKAMKKLERFLAND